MGIYTDLLANATAWDAGNSDGKVATDRVITKDIEQLRTSMGDITYPSGYAEKNDVQELAVFTGAVTGGNYTITVNLRDGTTVTTASILYDSVEATLQTRINDACSGNVAGWSSDDIVVAMTTDLRTTPATLTFSGDSVKGQNHPLGSMTDIDLAGGGTVGAVTQTTAGQTDRRPLAVLKASGLVSAIPEQGEIAGLVAALDREANPILPRQETLQALAKQAAIDDGSEALYAALLTAWGLGHLV